MSFISRSVTRVCSSSLYLSSAARLLTQKWVISRHITSGGESEAAVMAAEKELAQTNQIEYQQEPSNSVNLIGVVDEPVQSGSSSDGIFWAGTVISRPSESKLSPLWIPITFEGDLAKTAAQHLKKDDRIHISGKLSPDERRSNLQVIVQTLNFVEAISPEKSENVNVTDEYWKHLFENRKEWLDHRGNKANGLVKPGYPDFKRKDGGLSLWLNSAPDWILPHLQGLELDVIVPKQKQLKGEEFWNEFVQNLDKWRDNRSKKSNPKAPDFIHKKTGEALWMNESPTWVLSKLQEENPAMA